MQTKCRQILRCLKQSTECRDRRSKKTSLFVALTLIVLGVLLILAVHNRNRALTMIAFVLQIIVAILILCTAMALIALSVWLLVDEKAIRDIANDVLQDSDFLTENEKCKHFHVYANMHSNRIVAADIVAGVFIALGVIHLIWALKSAWFAAIIVRYRKYLRVRRLVSSLKTVHRYRNVSTPSIIVKTHKSVFMPSQCQQRYSTQKKNRSNCGETIRKKDNKRARNSLWSMHVNEVLHCLRQHFHW